MAYGRLTLNTHNGSGISGYFMSTTNLHSPQLIIKDDLSMESNHKFMTLSFQMALPSVSELYPPRLLWNLDKLKEPNTVSCYKSVLIEQSKILLYVSAPTFPDRSSASTHIEEINQNLGQFIYNFLIQFAVDMHHKLTLRFRIFGHLK